MVNLKALMYPQEVELHYILPAIRRELTTSLKAMGLEQKEIARLLQVSEPAISQYVTNKRAQEVRFNSKITEEVNKSAKRLLKEGSILRETQILLQLALTERVTCDVHCKLASIPSNCNVCFTAGK